MNMIDPEELFTIDDVETVSSNDASIVKMVVTIEGDTKIITGTAKRHPTDRRDDRVGVLLAHARALRSLANKLERRANGHLNQAEEMQRMKPIQKAKKMANAAQADTKGQKRLQRRSGRDFSEPSEQVFLSQLASAKKTSVDLADQIVNRLVATRDSIRD